MNDCGKWAVAGVRKPPRDEPAGDGVLGYGDCSVRTSLVHHSVWDEHLRRVNIHVVNQRGQRLRVSDGADDHRSGAAADRNFLLR